MAQSAVGQAVAAATKADAALVRALATCMIQLLTLPLPASQAHTLSQIKRDPYERCYRQLRFSESRR